MTEKLECPICGEKKNNLFEHMNSCDEGEIVLVGEPEGEPIVTEGKYLEAVHAIKQNPDVNPDSKEELSRLVLTWLGYPWQIDGFEDGSTIKG